MKCDWHDCEFHARGFIVKSTNVALVGSDVPIYANGIIRNYCETHKACAELHGFKVEKIGDPFSPLDKLSHPGIVSL